MFEKNVGHADAESLIFDVNIANKCSGKCDYFLSSAVGGERENYSS